MESYLAAAHFDLVSPDGYILHIFKRQEDSLELIVQIDALSPAFVGYKIDPSNLFFNIKSTLAQLGIESLVKEILLPPQSSFAKVHLTLHSLSSTGKKLLNYLQEGAFIGKLFAADPKRRVRDPHYLSRMFGRKDREGLPLLMLGEAAGENEFRLEKIDGYTIAFLELKEGVIQYDSSIDSFLPILAKALENPQIKTRDILPLYQNWIEPRPRKVQENEILLVRTLPLHIRTVFGRVATSLLPKGFQHTSANILQPDTKASGDVYELYGNAPAELTHIPLEFYTLEPHREYVFFSDRDQLQTFLEDPKIIFNAFKTAPQEDNPRASVFIVKGDQLLSLKKEDWIFRKVEHEPLSFIEEDNSSKEETKGIQNYIKNQPSYPFLKAIETGLITSQGVLFCRHFPSPLIKKMLLGDLVHSSLKRIYFQFPSRFHGDFFSHEDRSMLLDLSKVGITVYWADLSSQKILQFVPKPGKDAGMFVPSSAVHDFIKGTAFGVYGSNLIAVDFGEELSTILEGVKQMRQTMHHPLLNSNTPLVLITGGGPGVMEIGNQVAKKVGILSCANIVDFSRIHKYEQHQNPYIEAKMTYRIDRLVERQAEFNLDFPIFVMGGIGTDFELSLEQVRRKVSIHSPTPVLLLGTVEYWKNKITYCFATNLANGTIVGSEWISNCFFVVETAEDGLKVYKKYFSHELPLGKNGPIYKEGFVRP